MAPARSSAPDVALPGAPGTRSPVPSARSPNPVHAALARVAFKFSYKFSLIHVLHRALHHVMIHFKFRLFSVVCRTTIRLISV